MTADGLVAELRRRGIALVADGDFLRCRPRAALSDADLEVLREHKAEVLIVLRAERPRLVCYSCRSSRFWRSTYGAIVCGTCHPPARVELVAEWFDARPTESE